jgi:acetyltransferase-like isoleucine patch superfamily enzyme
MRQALKQAARGLATVAVSPVLVSYAVRRRIFGADRALENSSHALGLIPGTGGDYLRNAFLARVLAHCARSSTVRFGTSWSQPGAKVDEHVYVGPHCSLGLVHLERDVLLGPNVHIPSGARVHGTTDPHRAIRDQSGSPVCVRIGEGTWIGAGAIVLADVGRHAVVGAGSVVTRPVPDYTVAAGVPARQIRDRRTEARPADR